MLLGELGIQLSLDLSRPRLFATAATSHHSHQRPLGLIAPHQMAIREHTLAKTQREIKQVFYCLGHWAKYGGKETEKNLLLD